MLLISTLELIKT